MLLPKDTLIHLQRLEWVHNNDGQKMHMLCASCFPFLSGCEAKEPYMQSKAKLKELQLCMVETYMPAIETQYCSAAERWSN